MHARAVGPLRQLRGCVHLVADLIPGDLSLEARWFFGVSSCRAAVLESKSGAGVVAHLAGPIADADLSMVPTRESSGPYRCRKTEMMSSAVITPASLRCWSTTGSASRLYLSNSSVTLLLLLAHRDFD